MHSNYGLIHWPSQHFFFITYSIAITKKGGGKAWSMRLLKPSWHLICYICMSVSLAHTCSQSLHTSYMVKTIYHWSQPIIIPSILCEWKWLKVKSLGMIPNEAVLWLHNVEDQDIFCVSFWIRLYRVLIIEYAVGELLHMVLIIVYHPQWF